MGPHEELLGPRLFKWCFASGLIASRPRLRHNSFLVDLVGEVSRPINWSYMWEQGRKDSGLGLVGPTVLTHFVNINVT